MKLVECLLLMTVALIFTACDGEDGTDPDTSNFDGGNTQECSGKTDGTIINEGEFDGLCVYENDCSEVGHQTRVNRVCENGEAVERSEEAELDVCDRDTAEVVIVGPWDGACRYELDCIEMGLKTRMITRCLDGQTSVTEESDVVPECERDTDGIQVSDGEFGECEYETVCSVSGSKTRTIEVCVDGSALSMMEAAAFDECDRQTDGLIVEMGEPSGDCTYASACSQTGSQSRIDRVCAAGVEVSQEADELSDICDRVTQDDDCGAGRICSEGECGCPAGTPDACESYCTDFSVSVSDCGGCSQFCPATATCTNAECVCPDGEDICGAECVFLASDVNHCGACDRACDSGISCLEGECQCRSEANVFDADGGLSSKTTKIYDASGRPLMIDLDSNGDGQVNRRILKSYDSEGRLISEATDNQNDGLIDNEVTYAYDDAGNRISLSTFQNGALTSKTTYVFDTQNVRTTVQIDRDGDGTVDVIQNETYDAAGNLLSSIGVSAVDETIITSRSLYTFDDMNRKTSTLVEFNFDSQGNPGYVYRLEYDFQAGTSTETYDSNGDGSSEQRFESTIDEAGRPLRTEGFSQGSLVPTSIDTYAYSGTGKLILMETDLDANGEIDRRQVYEYNSADNLIAYSVDEGGDGMVNLSETRSYSCPDLNLD